MLPQVGRICQWLQKKVMRQALLFAPSIDVEKLDLGKDVFDEELVDFVHNSLFFFNKF